MQILSTSASRVAAIRAGAIAVGAEAAIFRIQGPGAVSCLQGVLSSDVEHPGDGSVVYGAALTPKGMIAFDLHSLRYEGEFLLVADPAAREAAAGLFRRLLPPRLARVTDLSADWRAHYLLGPASDALLASLAPDPGPGRCLVLESGPLWLARGGAQAPWRWLALGPPGAIDRVAEATASAQPGNWDDVRLARVLAGVPTLGAEIGDRTLPQEVRCDELGGVSYTKGCYIGQETVARVHFRGRPNWLLRGVRLGSGLPPAEELSLDGKPVGRLTTVAVLDSGPSLALATVRREVEPEADLTLRGVPVRVVGLPFTEP